MRQQVTRYASLALALIVTACGETENTFEEFKERAKGSDDRSGPSANAELIQAKLKNRTFEEVASYPATSALDVVMILGAGVDLEKLVLAAPTLTARLRHTDVDYRLTIVGEDPAAVTLSAQRPDLGEAIAAQLAAAPSRDAAASLAAVLARGDAVRGETELAVVFLGSGSGFAPPPHGRISALAPIEPGCEGSEASAAFEIAGAVVRSGGMQVSTCAATYAYFFDQLLALGSDATHFRVVIPEGAIWDTLQIAAGESIVSGWKYAPGTQDLWVPRLVPAGAPMRIRYEVDRGNRPNLASTPFAELGLP